MGITDIHSLSHTKWNCKYHIVFAPKYRRKSILLRKKESNRGNIEKMMWVERREYIKGRSMSGSCTHAGRDTAENECIKFYGVFERKKQHDVIWAIQWVEI